MVSVDFTRARAGFTRDAAAILATPPTSFVWSQKSVPQWDAAIATLDQLRSAEGLKRAEWRQAAETWQLDLNAIQDITRQVARIGAVHFRNDRVKRVAFTKLRTDGEARDAVFAQGEAARDAWQVADAAWEISGELTLGSFSSLLATALARRATHSTKLAAWRNASAALMQAAEALDRDNIAWYAEVTERFAAGTTAGDMIRSTVPTTTRPEQAVGQAVVSNVMAAGGDIHFDVSAPHATRYTYLQKAPGSPVFLVVVADTPSASLTLHGQPAGLHQFKAFGSNADGTGLESAVVEVTVAQAAVA